jgi:hypothetical protein
MFIDPKTEDQARRMLGHIIRQEFDELENQLREIGEETFLRALALYIPVAGYIAVDVAGRWPTDADVGEIARHTADSARGFDLSQDAVTAFLSRVALGADRMADVFPSANNAVMLPLQVTGTLLLAFLPRGKHWWEYLDVIENALDTAEQADLSLLPALMLRSHRVQAASAAANAAATEG